MRVVVAMIAALVVVGCAPYPRVVSQRYPPARSYPMGPQQLPPPPLLPLVATLASAQPAAPLVIPAAPFGDSTLVVIQNVSRRAVIYCSIDDGPPLPPIPPLSASGNIYVGPGEHLIRWWGEVPTAHPSHPVLRGATRILPFLIRAEEGAKIIPLTE